MLEYVTKLNVHKRNFDLLLSQRAIVHVLTAGQCWIHRQLRHKAIVTLVSVLQDFEIKLFLWTQQEVELQGYSLEHFLLEVIC